jgi:hypothetical protein
MVVEKVWHTGAGGGCHDEWPVARDEHGTLDMPCG